MTIFHWEILFIDILTLPVKHYFITNFYIIFPRIKLMNLDQLSATLKGSKLPTATIKEALTDLIIFVMLMHYTMNMRPCQ